MNASLLMAILVAATTHLPKANTRAAIQTYVEEAAKVVRTSGPSCAMFASPQWRGGQWYIFVNGPDDKIVCHLRADLIGKAPSVSTNAKGEKVGAMINAKAAGNGKGWVEYLWAPPGKTAEDLKSTYVMGVTGPDGKHYVVGAGGWNVAK